MRALFESATMEGERSATPVFGAMPAQTSLGFGAAPHTDLPGVGIGDLSR